MNKHIEKLSQASSIEELFLIPKDAPQQHYADVMGCILARARASLHMIEADGAELETGFTHRHDIVMDALWGIGGYIDQAIQLNKHSVTGGAK